MINYFIVPYQQYSSYCEQLKDSKPDGFKELYNLGICHMKFNNQAVLFGEGYNNTQALHYLYPTFFNQVPIPKEFIEQFPTL